MKLILTLASVVLAPLFVPSTTLVYERELATTTVQVLPSSKAEIEQLILLTARRHGIDEERFLATAKCESSLRPAVVGDGGASIGLFQIHLISHPTVTEAQASDPVWATEWSAKKFAENPNIWTCYRKLYGNTDT